MPVQGIFFALLRDEKRIRSSEAIFFGTALSSHALPHITLHGKALNPTDQARKRVIR